MRRTSHVAKLLAESGSIALVSLVSPYSADRQAAAAMHGDAELGFLEIFLSASLELCQERDPKGLYARARSGELAGMTGVGAPYEQPSEPDLVLCSHTESVEEEVDKVIELLLERGLVAPLTAASRRLLSRAARDSAAQLVLERDGVQGRPLARLQRLVAQRHVRAVAAAVGDLHDHAEAGHRLRRLLRHGAELRDVAARPFGGLFGVPGPGRFAQLDQHVGAGDRRR